VHLHQTFSTFKNPKNRSSTTSQTLNIENEWPNYNEYVVTMEEEE
jgi:hypothetical protein